MLVIYGSVDYEPGSAVPLVGGRAAEQAMAAVRDGASVVLHARQHGDAAAELPADSAGGGIRVHRLSADASFDDSAIEPGSRVAILNVDLPYALLMSAASAARARGVTVVLHLADLPDWLDMPKLHALLGRTDLLVLRGSDLEKAADLLGRDMLGDYGSPAEMTSALAYWASFAVVATMGAEGALFAQGDTPAQRFIAPMMELFDAPRAQNMFSGVLGARLALNQPYETAIVAAIAAASQSGDAQTADKDVSFVRNTPG